MATLGQTEDEGRRATARRRCAAALALAGAALAGAQAAPISLAPLYGGATATVAGAQAAFFQIDGAWQGSTVLWNEPEHRYGDGLPIGSYAWGTGLWGLADWQAAQAAGQGAPGGPPIVDQWLGYTPTISYGNPCFNVQHGATLGTADIVPMFSAGGACDDAKARTEENWTAHFSGVIRITQPGAYHFGVLNDDGFFLRLVGAGGATQSIGRDYLNSPERTVFDDALLLDVGLYGFELGEWNRLLAGVVDLRWQGPGGDGWELVPTERLLVPEPASLALALGALAGAAGVRRRRDRRA